MFSGKGSARQWKCKPCTACDDLQCPFALQPEHTVARHNCCHTDHFRKVCSPSSSFYSDTVHSLCEEHKTVREEEAEATKAAPHVVHRGSIDVRIALSDADAQRRGRPDLRLSPEHVVVFPQHVAGSVLRTVEPGDAGVAGMFSFVNTCAGTTCLTQRRRRVRKMLRLRPADAPPSTGGQSARSACDGVQQVPCSVSICCGRCVQCLQPPYCAAAPGRASPSGVAQQEIRSVP